MPRQKIFNEETVAFSIRLPASMRSQIQDLANEHRRSLNQEIVWLIQNALEYLDQGPDGEEKQS